MKTKRLEIILISVLTALFIATFVLTSLFPKGYILGGDYEYLVTIIISFALLSWGISMIWRVQYKKQRIYIIILVLSFFFWILLRFVKWLPNIHYVTIYADYFYYVPMTLIPIIFFMMTTDTFFPNLKNKKIIYTILIILAYLLIALVLTNELHYLVYRNFKVTYADDPNIEIITSEYGPLHYVALGFVGLVSIAALIVFLIGSRKQVSLKQLFVVSCSFIFIIIYIVLFTIGILSNVPLLRDFATSITLLLSLLLESLLSTGLIQNNGKYATNFSKASIGIGIYDENNKEIYKTSAFDLTKENIKVLDKNIGEYKIKIIEDLSSIHDLQDSIKREIDEIDSKNNSLKKLIEISKEESSLNYRLTLMNEIENNITTTKNEILSLVKTLPDKLDDSSKKTLGYIAMLLGYMKQKCMLLLRTKEQTSMDYEQASLLMDVISRDIISAGYEDVAINLNKTTSFDVKFLSKINDFIHEIAKNYAFSDSELLIFIDYDSKICKARIIGKDIVLKDVQSSKSSTDDEGIIHILEVTYE